MVFKPTVNDVANDIKIGAVDAGFIWDTLVAQDAALEAIPLPELKPARAHMAVAVLRQSRTPTAALRFARYLAARDKGMKHFTAHQFTVIEGDHGS